jgi:hypothetical protein
MYDQAQLSEEELGLFNPAYTGFLLYSSVREYVIYKEGGMHCALPFIVIPIAMNKAVAHTLPSTYKTPIATWVAKNEGVLSDFPSMAKSYNPIVRAAIQFLLDRSVLELNDSGCFLLKEESLARAPTLFGKSSDMAGALSAARMLGRWFSHAPSPETIYAQIGIRP